MSKRERHKLSWAASFVTLLALTACSNSGGGGHAADTATTSSTTAKTTTTVEPETTTTTVPPPYSFDGSVPPPELINSGTDYEAIFRDLDAYAHWISAHSPDQAAVDEVYMPGTDISDRVKQRTRVLVDGHLRSYDSASVVTGVELVTVKRDAVSLLAHYTDDRAVVVTRSGTEIDNTPLPSSSTFLILLTADAEGRWYIASSDYQEP